MEEIKKTSRRYGLQVIIAANVLMLITVAVQYLFGADMSLIGPAAVAYAFYLATAGIFCYIWQKVATANPEILTTVYMATSGFRMLAALATLTGVYVAVGRERMLPYAVVFMIFYLVAVGHHSTFFARFNNKQ